ncbi:hypothetical protein ACFX2I_004047 [Malus domestica]|uniref:Leucine-rich repeat-containing N-terminal plant-type domain-containing protein n=1 Tax=Malus domestica TaxID=3750 RepID=A0A498IVM9_MALDO|nr:piriformospora indica-insensitive protein 2 [Malus domestica]RXH87260.1 hypothetical protein DVH24_028760 [Malus domestica]
MALFHPFSKLTLLLLLLLTTLLSIAVISQPLLTPAEQDAVYTVLGSVNPDISWRSLFPDDLCLSAPHGVVCDFFYDNVSSPEPVAHVTEMNFGYVSDYTPNPPCSANATFSPLLFTSFKYLRKLFFYRCFTGTRVSFPEIPKSFGSGLEELVFIDNPSLVGSLSVIIRNFTDLRRVVLTGNGVYGNIPDGVADLVNLEELTLSRNQLGGEIPLMSFSKLKKLKVLDLGYNYFSGTVPESVGNLSELVKLDLRSNGFNGKIPESLKNLKTLELLDLSRNNFTNYGVPLFLGDMPRLKQLDLSGNLLGGQIPKIWDKLGGILGIGFSEMGLVGEIPASMGVHLKNLRYLGLDNNKLEGTVPEELGLLESVSVINLQNNNLSGRVSFGGSKFSAKFGQNLKLAGNPNLCADDKALILSSKTQLKVCKKTQKPNSAPLTLDSSVQVVVLPNSVIMFGTCVLFVLIFA